MKFTVITLSFPNTKIGDGEWWESFWGSSKFPGKIFQHSQCVVTSKSLDLQNYDFKYNLNML